QVRDGGLGHAVDGFSGQRDRARLGADVDDLPRPLADHDAPGGLAGQEGPLEVDGQGGVEVFFLDVFGQVPGSNARVVDEDVHTAEVPDNRVHRGTDLLGPGHVHLQ